MSFIKITRTPSSRKRNPAILRLTLLATFLWVLAFILGYFGQKYSNIALELALPILLFVGLVLFSRANLESVAEMGDTEFEKFILKANKIQVILTISIIAILIIGSGAFFLTESWTVFMTMMILTFATLGLYSILVIKTFIEAKKSMVRSYNKYNK